MTLFRMPILPMLLVVLAAIACHGADEPAPLDLPDPPEPQAVPQFRLLQFDHTFGSIPEGTPGDGDDSPDIEVPTGRDISRILRDSDHDFRPPQVSMPVRPMNPASSQPSTGLTRGDTRGNWLVDRVFGYGVAEEEGPADPKEEALRAIRGETGTDGAGERWLAALIEENARMTEEGSAAGLEDADAPELGEGVDPILDLISPDGMSPAGPTDGTDALALDPMLGVRLGQALRASEDGQVTPMSRAPGEVLGVELGGGTASAWEGAAGPGLGADDLGGFGGAPVGSGPGGIGSIWAGPGGATSTVAGLRGAATATSSRGADAVSQAGSSSTPMDFRRYRTPSGVNRASGRTPSGGTGLDLPATSFDAGSGFSTPSGTLAFGSGGRDGSSLSPWGRSSGGPMSSGMNGPSMRSPFDQGRQPIMATPPPVARGHDWLAAPSMTPAWGSGRARSLTSPGSAIGSPLGSGSMPINRPRLPSVAPPSVAARSPWSAVNPPLTDGR